MDGMKAYKRSLWLDCACIAVAAVVLYCANKNLLPASVLITGAIVALVLLLLAIGQLLKARRLFKQEAEQHAQLIEQAQHDAEDAPSDTPTQSQES